MPDKVTDHAALSEDEQAAAIVGSRVVQDYASAGKSVVVDDGDLCQRANEILAARGVADPTEEQLAVALEQAERERPVVGDDKPVDGLDLVARAEKILADAGKTEPTEDEYASALEQAEREQKVARATAQTAVLRRRRGQETGGQKTMTDDEIEEEAVRLAVSDPRGLAFLQATELHEKRLRAAQSGQKAA